MEVLYKFNECYRDGSLNGLLIIEEDVLDQAISEERIVSFGEVLGKHSDVSYQFSKGSFEEVSRDPEFLEKIREHSMEFGYDPFQELIPCENCEWFIYEDGVDKCSKGQRIFPYFCSIYDNGIEV